VGTFTRNRASDIALLGEPVRRELHRLANEAPLGRDDAAERLGIPRSTAAFHLERLVEAGLLEVEYRRRSGRTGPGAGRPSKLYRAAPGEIAGSVPERHYELAGDLLASAVERSERDGVPVREALGDEAFSAGVVLGTGCPALEEALTACGYEPRAAASGDIVLDNCPFHALATRHTELVCSANVALVRGLAHASSDDRDVELAPQEGLCCVTVRARRSGSAHEPPPEPPDATQ
jgi:predicted ArsR family transcriptional regulator